MRRTKMAHPRRTALFDRAIVRAAILLILSFVGFVIVPDRMQAYLSLHVVPRTRDGLVLLWVMAFFLFMCWMFVRLQRREWG